MTNISENHDSPLYRIRANQVMKVKVVKFPTVTVELKKDLRVILGQPTFILVENKVCGLCLDENFNSIGAKYTNMILCLKCFVIILKTQNITVQIQYYYQNRSFYITDFRDLSQHYDVERNRLQPYCTYLVFDKVMRPFLETNEIEHFRNSETFESKLIYNFDILAIKSLIRDFNFLEVNLSESEKVIFAFRHKPAQFFEMQCISAPIVQIPIFHTKQEVLQILYNPLDYYISYNQKSRHNISLVKCDICHRHINRYISTDDTNFDFCEECFDIINGSFKKPIINGATTSHLEKKVILMD